MALFPQRARRAASPFAYAWLLVAIMCIVGILMLASAGRGPAQAQAQAAEFADPAFKALWDRTDGLVASGAAKRPWIWGPAPGATLSEPFIGLPKDQHLVQFFDKGRMELNNPNGDKSDPFYVSNGRLA